MSYNFSIVTEDGVYNYINNTNSTDKYTDQEYFKNEHNNKTANTQGFLIKVQKGNERMRATVQLADTLAAINANLYPMLTYPDSLNVTFHRDIPFRGTNTGKFEMIDFDIVKEFPGQGIGGVEVIEVKISLVEVIAV